MDATTYYSELMFIFLKIIQLQKLMKKAILTEILFLRRKYKKHQEKTLGCKFIKINASKEDYDANYGIGRIQTFISKFKERQLRKLEKQSNKKNKRTRK